MRVGVNIDQRDRIIEKLKTKDSLDLQGIPTHEATNPTHGWATGNISMEQAIMIAAAMHSHSMPAAVGLARNYDLTGIRSILDVGGGSGCFMIAMAQLNPALKCTIMDLNTMCEVAVSYIKSGRVYGQVDTIAVNMFREEWPNGYDALFFSNIFHDWSFKTCEWLAQRAYNALPDGGRIMLHEMLLNDDGAGSITPSSFSLMMLLCTQGQQFTFGELKAILEKVGFIDIQVRPTAGYYSITTGYKKK